MKFKANAKINLGLFITGINHKKYHLLDATMLPVSLYDEIEICFSKDNQDNVIIENMEISKDNTITKAIALLRNHFKFNKYFNIKVIKGIPSGAGLGGGSSDAAFVMKAIIKLLNLDCDNKTLSKLALEVGADVPFFLINKSSRMEGIGEILTPFKVNKKYSFLLIKPIYGINTVDCYKKYDELNHFNESNIKKIILMLQKGLEISEVHNDLWESARFLQPKLYELEKRIKELSPKLLTMSGSGSTLVVYDSKENLEYIKSKISKEKDIELCQIVDIIN